MQKQLAAISVLIILGLACRLKVKQEFTFQPRPGLTMRCQVKGVRHTAYEGAEAANLNYDLKFEKAGDDTVYFLFDSLQVECNGAKSHKTSCRTASVNVISHREMIPKGECLYPLFSVFPEGAELSPVTALTLVKNGLFDEPY